MPSSRAMAAASTTGGRSLDAGARARPGVHSATPLIEQPLMASHDGRVEAILVRGMPREDILANPTISRQRRRRLARRAHARAAAMSRSARGSPRRSAFPSAARSPSSARRAAPRRSARCRGSSTTTSPRSSRSASTIIDKAFVIMPMRGRADLADDRRCGRHGRGRRPTDADRVGEILAPLQPAVAGRAIVNDWRSMNSALFEALQVERVAMFVVLSHHHPGRGVQHPLLADHAGPRQDPRHRHPAHDGRDAARR